MYSFRDLLDSGVIQRCTKKGETHPFYFPAVPRLSDNYISSLIHYVLQIIQTTDFAEHPSHYVDFYELELDNWYEVFPHDHTCLVLRSFANYLQQIPS